MMAKKAHPEKVDPGIGRQAMKRAKDRQSSYSEYIRLHYQATGNLAPGCDARDWLAKNSDVSLAEFSIDKEDRQLRGLTSEEWQIVFNESQTAAEQGFIIKKVLEQEIKDKRRDLEYFDLRIENRIYYKYRNQDSKEDNTQK